MTGWSIPTRADLHAPPDHRRGLLMFRGTTRSLGRRLLRFVAWSTFVVVLLIMLLISAMYWLMRTESGREQVRRIALHFVKDILPGLDVGAIEGDFVNGLTFHRVVLRDRFGGEAITCKRLSVRYDLRALLVKRIQVHSAVIDQPRVLLRTTHLNSVNMAELVDPGDGEAAPEPEPAPEGPPRVGPDLLGGWVLKARCARDRRWNLCATAGRSVDGSERVGDLAGHLGSLGWTRGHAADRSNSDACQAARGSRCGRIPEGDREARGRAADSSRAAER